jgi:hypothetical protein
MRWATDHGIEIGLLAIIAVGVLALLIIVARQKVEGWDVAACLMVLQAIISAVKERWTQRSVDKMGQQLGQSSPNNEGSTNV